MSQSLDSSRFVSLVKWSCILIFLGRAWQHLVWDAPYHTFWEDQVVVNIITRCIGVFYLGMAVLTIGISERFRRLSWLYGVAAGLMTVLALCYWKEKQYDTIQFFEYGIQVVSPIALYLLLFRGIAAHRVILILKIAIACTFTAHGLYAMGVYPTPSVFIDMTTSILGVSEAGANQFLKVVGILDLMLSVGIFFPKISGICLLYAVLWGFLTALARVVAHVEMGPDFWALLTEYLPQTIYRLAHGLIPLSVWVGEPRQGDLPEAFPAGADQMTREVQPAKVVIRSPAPLNVHQVSALEPPPSPKVVAFEEVQSNADIVNVSAYAPAVVKKATRFLFSAFVHLFEQGDIVDEMAAELDPDAVRQGRKTLNFPIKRGSQLQLGLEVEGWKIDEPMQAVTWFGQPASAEFIVQVPGNYKANDAFGILRLIGPQGPLGRVKFRLKVQSRSLPKPEKPSFAEVDSRRYRQAYLSYDDQDYPSVHALLDEYQTQGADFATLPRVSGDRIDWEEQAVMAIRKADFFYLFWSEAASQSARVTTEWEHALGLRYREADRLPDIIPYSLERPAPSLPQALAFLNVNHDPSFMTPQRNREQSGIRPMVLGSSVSASRPTSDPSPANLKARCQALIDAGNDRIFQVLTDHFIGNDEIETTLIMLEMRWKTAKRKERLGLIHQSDLQVEQNQVIFSLLEIVGQIS